MSCAERKAFNRTSSTGYVATLHAIPPIYYAYSGLESMHGKFFLSNELITRQSRTTHILMVMHTRCFAKCNTNRIGSIRRIGVNRQGFAFYIQRIYTYVVNNGNNFLFSVYLTVIQEKYTIISKPNPKNIYTYMGCSQKITKTKKLSR